MSQVKSQELATDGSTLYTFSDMPDKKFTKIANQDIYVNKDGETIYYDQSTKTYKKTSLRPQLIAPSYSTYETDGLDMDDGNASKGIMDTLNGNKYKFTKSSPIIQGANDLNYDTDPLNMVLHQNNLYRSSELDIYNKTYRFGYFDPNPLTTAKEFLFFTKPDLHIFGDDPNLYSGSYYETKMNHELANIPFWYSLARTNRNTISLLQSSLSKVVGGNPDDKFNHLLQNQCISNLEIPALSSEMTETATNMYGVGFSYRGSSEASDDKPTFSLEFKDTKYLDVYYYFKAYEEYETMKHHGTVSPRKEYIEKKIMHDQIAIYKFLVDEDMETILYYGKMYGVVPKSLPREVFGSTNFDNGLSFTVDFEAAFYEDMKPEIIRDFNKLSESYYNSKKYRIDIYNNQLDGVDVRPTDAAFVEIITNANALENYADYKRLKRSPGGYLYKLRWKGDEKI